MKIALILYSDRDFGGAERRLIRLFGAIAKTHEVSLILRGCSSDELESRLLKSDCCATSFHSVHCFKNRSSIIENIHALKRALFWRPDACVFVDANGFNILASLVLKLFRIGTLLVLANCLYYYDAVRDGKCNKKLLLLMQSVDAVDLLYPGQLEHYRSLVNKPSKISITPGTYTDLSIFKPCADKQNTFVFIAARLEKDKNPIMVVEAAKQCEGKLRLRKYKVKICGQGFEEEHIRQAIDRYGLSDIVEMPGYVRTFDILPHAKVICAVGLSNNYPSQTIAEASACGCFLVATNVGETYRLLDDSYSKGIEPSAEKLAKAMTWYMDLDSYSQRAYGDAARKYAEKHFSMSPSLQYYMNICESIKQSRSREMRQDKE